MDKNDKTPPDLAEGEKVIPLPDGPAVGVGLRNPVTQERDGSVWITTYFPHKDDPSIIELRGFPLDPMAAVNLLIDIQTAVRATQEGKEN